MSSLHSEGLEQEGKVVESLVVYQTLPDGPLLLILTLWTPLQIKKTGDITLGVLCVHCESHIVGENTSEQK